MSNSSLNISVHTPPGPLPAMPAGRSSAGKNSTAPVATNPQQRNICWCKHEPQQQQAAPKAEMVLQQGTSGCCQQDGAWCQLGRWKGLDLPTGVTRYSLPAGREQGRGGMNNCASKRVAFASSMQYVFLQKQTNPRGEQKELSVLEKRISFPEECLLALKAPVSCDSNGSCSPLPKFSWPDQLCPCTSIPLPLLQTYFFPNTSGLCAHFCSLQASSEHKVPFT